MRFQSSPDIATVKRLLRAVDLPTEDLTVDQMAHFFSATVAGDIVGVIGAVPCGPDALLRSLVVAERHRRLGVGSRLVDMAEAHALRLGARRLYLLTLTAEVFFRDRGYRALSRESAPEAVRDTPEYRGLCPVTAILMCKPLEACKGG